MATSSGSEFMATTAGLRLIRYSMLAGVLIFAACATYMARSRTVPAADAEFIRNEQWAALVVAALAVLMILLMRRMRERASTALQRNNLALIGSAVPEGLALFGGVIMILGGPAFVLLAGILLFIVAWRALPGEDAPSPS